MLFKNPWTFAFKIVCAASMWSILKKIFFILYGERRLSLFFYNAESRPLTLGVTLSCEKPNRKFLKYSSSPQKDNGKNLIVAQSTTHQGIYMS